MSYTKVEEEETGKAERQIRSQQDGESIPGNYYHGVFPQSAWDNSDLEECVPSGSGTTHCTNGIVIQIESDGCESKSSDIVNKLAKRDSKSSLDIVPVQILPYSDGKKHHQEE